MKKRKKIEELHEHIGETVNVCGWVDARRDHGKLIFLDLRDSSAKLQAVALPKPEDVHDVADQLRSEWVVSVEGVVNKRPDKMVNSEEAMGDIELEIKDVEVLSEADTPPFDLSTEGFDVKEELRMEYRYLDIRRDRMQKNLRKRSAVNNFLRNSLAEKDFIEVETPILTRSTPEGARDYIVPSRIDKGSFYALPQSPQQYKQLLMVGGVERYFQLARCMRDEDTRGDRQPEFTQLDMECSFVEREDIILILEEVFSKMVEELFPEKHITETPWPRISHEEALGKYGSDRPDIRKDPNDPSELGFAWVVDFPLFEKEKSDEGFFQPEHHMFTAPKDWDVNSLISAPQKAISQQVDLSLNGFEVAGGSIRIHKAEVQRAVFDLIGFTEKQKEEFSHMLKAFRYGVPPHGGIAVGMDRFMAVLENETNIREVIAFPKTGEGRDLMMSTPSEVEKEQLRELGLEIDKPKKKNSNN
ncbi:MAG: aspartate--tRNA ligase [Patescibacteria group bacterium]